MIDMVQASSPEVHREQTGEIWVMYEKWWVIPGYP